MTKFYSFSISPYRISPELITLNESDSPSDCVACYDSKDDALNALIDRAFELKGQLNENMD